MFAADQLRKIADKLVDEHKCSLSEIRDQILKVNKHTNLVKKKITATNNIFSKICTEVSEINKNISFIKENKREKAKSIQKKTNLPIEIRLMHKKEKCKQKKV